MLLILLCPSVCLCLTLQVPILLSLLVAHALRKYLFPHSTMICGLMFLLRRLSPLQSCLNPLKMPLLQVLSLKVSPWHFHLLLQVPCPLQLLAVLILWFLTLKMGLSSRRLSMPSKGNLILLYIKFFLL